VCGGAPTLNAKNFSSLAFLLGHKRSLCPFLFNNAFGDLRGIKRERRGIKHEKDGKDDILPCHGSCPICGGEPMDVKA